MGLFGGGNSTSSTTNNQYTTNNAFDMRSITDARQEITSNNWTNNQTDARDFSSSLSNVGNTTTSLADVGNSWTSLSDSRNLSTSLSDVGNSWASLTNSGNTSLQVLDAGAIDAGKSVALAGISNNATNTASLFAVADSLFSKTSDALAANTKLAASLAGGASQAYADATSQANGNKNLVYAGMAVVAVVAVSMLMRR